MRKLLSVQLILVVGLLVFVSAKGVFIVAQTTAMGMPRLGDDALTHLWRARQIDEIGISAALRGDLAAASRGTKDIAAFCQPTLPAPPREQAQCDRIADNIAVADVKAGSSIILNGIMKLGLPLNWSYAVYELFIMTVIAASFGFFLYRLFGPAPAGIGLILLSFMTLVPPQGLHQFIPSTLTIGLSLALWGTLIGRASIGRYIAAAVGFLILSRIHPVALVFAGGMIVFALYAFRDRLTPKVVVVTAVAAIAILGLFVMVNDVIRDIIQETLSGSVFDKLTENVKSIPASLRRLAANNWAICGALIVGTVFYWRTIKGWIAATGAALLLLIIASLFYSTNFFVFKIPLDLFSRIFVAFAVFACGLIGVFLLDAASRARRWSWVVVTAGIALLPLPSYFPWANSMLENINGRREVIDEALLEMALTKIDRDATLAYGALGVAPMALFLAGAADRGAIPMKGMGAENLRQALDQRRPAAIVFPNFHILNSLAAVRSPSFDKRRYGLATAIVDTLAVSSQREGIDTLYLRVENESSSPVSIGPFSYLADDLQQHALPSITVPAGAKDWIAIEMRQFAPGHAVIITLNEPGLWIRGIALNEPPRTGVDWPWDSEAAVRWHMRGRPQEAVTGVVFAVPELFRYWVSPGVDMIPLAQHSRVMSDESGIVFIATDYGVPP